MAAKGKQGWTWPARKTIDNPAEERQLLAASKAVIWKPQRKTQSGSCYHLDIFNSEVLYSL